MQPEVLFSHDTTYSMVLQEEHDPPVIYKGPDSNVIYRQIEAAVADPLMHHIAIQYSPGKGHDTLHLQISNQAHYKGKFLVHVTITNNTYPQYRPDLPADRFQYGGFMVTAAELPAQLQKIKAWYSQMTHVRTLHVDKFFVGYRVQSDRNPQRGLARSHADPAVISELIRNGILKELHRRQMARKIQRAFLTSYYDPAHPIAQRRLTREFESLSRQ